MSATGNPGTFRDDPEYVRARREIIRANHPDRGGSDEQLITALRGLDDQWERRIRVRRNVESVRLPDFIPEDVARQATDFAERTSGEVLRRAEDLRAKGAVIAHSPKTRQFIKAAERAARNAERTVRSRLPRNFPGARRYTETRTRRDDE